MKPLNFVLILRLSNRLPCKNVVRFNTTMRSVSQTELVEYYPPDWAKGLKNVPNFKIKVGGLAVTPFPCCNSK